MIINIYIYINGKLLLLLLLLILILILLILIPTHVHTHTHTHTHIHRHGKTRTQTQILLYKFFCRDASPNKKFGISLFSRSAAWQILHSFYTLHAIDKILFPLIMKIARWKCNRLDPYLLTLREFSTIFSRESRSKSNIDYERNVLSRWSNDDLTIKKEKKRKEREL